VLVEVDLNTDTRRFPRKPNRFPVTCSLPNYPTIQGETVNTSVSGICFEAYGPNTYTTGRIIQLEASCGRINATVRWSHGNRMGLEFTMGNLSSQERQLLRS